MIDNILWYLQGSSDTEIAETDVLRFAGVTFSDPIIVGEYNDSTHVRTSVGADKSSANSPRNNKFISQTGGTGGDSQVQVDGGATEDLDALTNADAALKIIFSDAGSFSLEDLVFFAYNGVSQATAPPGLDIRVAEIGDTNFVQAEGSGAALALSNQGPATSIDCHLVISVSPTAPGLKSMMLRIEGTAL